LTDRPKKQVSFVAKEKQSSNIGTAPKTEVLGIVSAEHSDPFHILGIHPIAFRGQPAVAVRAFLPEARQAWVIPMDAGDPFPMERIHPRGFFETVFPKRNEVFPTGSESWMIKVEPWNPTTPTPFRRS
jgi:hypothetical protein